MSGRSLLAVPSVRALVPLTGLCLWAACSSEPTDFFGEPAAMAGSGTAAAGSSSAGVSGTGSTQGGSGGASAGSGTAAGGLGATGGSAPVGGSNPGGGNTNVSGSSGSSPTAGGSAQGGTTPDGGMSGENGAGETGTGGTISGGEAGTSGGMAGESGGSTGGTGGSAGGTGGSAGSTAGSGNTGGQPGNCEDDGDCPSTSQYCKKTSCDAATGTCTQRATACVGADATFAPVCGCDHMTYYTACVASHQGVNVTTSGECGSGAATCSRNAGSGASCDPHRDRAACYRTRNLCNTASAPDEGVCWVLPETCPDEDEDQLDCNNGDSLCRGLCDALEQKRPVVRDSAQCN